MLEIFKDIGALSTLAVAAVTAFYLSAILAGEWVKLYRKFRGPTITEQHWRGDPIKLKLEK